MLSSRRLLAVAASLFVASSLPAQGISWGPAVGLNLATLADDDSDAKMLMGFAVGVQLDKHTAGKGLFWRAGVGYSMQGSKAEDAGPPAFTAKLKLNYINVPVLAGWKFTPTNPASPYLLIGPQLGINVGCNFEAEGGGLSFNEPCDDPSIDAQTKAFDVGAVIGGGIGFAAGASMIHVAATYNFGLMTIDDGDPADDVKQRVFAITVSYMMPSKRKVN